jgi:hypothetical protein
VRRRRWLTSGAGGAIGRDCSIRYLRQPARLAAVDREPQWVREGEQQFLQAFPGADPKLLQFVQGDAEKIPLRTIHMTW